MAEQDRTLNATRPMTHCGFPTLAWNCAPPIYIYVDIPIPVVVEYVVKYYVIFHGIMCLWLHGTQWHLQRELLVPLSNVQVATVFFIELLSETQPGPLIRPPSTSGFATRREHLILHTVEQHIPRRTVLWPLRSTGRGGGTCGTSL